MFSILEELLGIGDGPHGPEKKEETNQSDLQNVCLSRRPIFRYKIQSCGAGEGNRLAPSITLPLLEKEIPALPACPNITVSTMGSDISVVEPHSTRKFAPTPPVESERGMTKAAVAIGSNRWG